MSENTNNDFYAQDKRINDPKVAEKLAYLEKPGRDAALQLEKDMSKESIASLTDEIESLTANNFELHHNLRETIRKGEILKHNVLVANNTEQRIGKETDKTILDILSPLEDPDRLDSPRKQVVPFERTEEFQENEILKEIVYGNNEQNSEEKPNIGKIECKYKAKFIDAKGSINNLSLTVDSEKSFIKIFHTNNGGTNLRDNVNQESYIPISQSETAAKKFIDIYKTNTNQPTGNNK